MADSGGGKKPSGALNVERRTWDVEHFEKVAKEKLERVRAWDVCVFMTCSGWGGVLLYLDVWARMTDGQTEGEREGGLWYGLMWCLPPLLLYAPSPSPARPPNPHTPTHYKPPHTTQQAAGQDAGKPKPGFVRKREEFLSADSGAQGPEGSKRAFLKHREQDLRLDEKINKIQVCMVGWV